MSSLNKDSLRIFLSLNAFFFSFLFFSYFFFLFFFCGLITLAKMSIILLNISGKVDIFASFLVLMRKHIEINSLSVAWFAIIFSHSEGCLFTLLIVSFVVQKLLISLNSSPTNFPSALLISPIRQASFLHVPFLTLLITWRLYFCLVSALHFLHSIPTAASSVQNHSLSKVHISTASQAVPPKQPQILPLHCSGHLSKAFFSSYWSCLWTQGFPIKPILLSMVPKHVVQL